jgi:hypothetical protein
LVGDEKQYEFVTSRMKDIATAPLDSLKLFVPMYSAIWGGSIWLRLQIKEQPVPEMYKDVSGALMALLTGVCILIVVYNICAWWGYRKMLVRLVGESASAAIPPRWTAAIIELIICVGMLAAGWLFCKFNPFGSSWHV